MNKSVIPFISLILFSLLTAKAQVTIGSGTAPKYFSILEIDAANTKGGLRLPQLLKTERDTISVNGNTSTAPGLVIYNKTDNTLEYWNGTAWVKALEIEPFMVSGSTTKASQNTQNIYLMGRIGIGANTPAYMLDVNEANTTIDPMRIRTLLSGASADSIVSINNSGILKKRSVFALRKDIVEPPVPATQAFPGMIKYDAATKTMQYYDGTTWQIIASNALFTKNEGVVRINSGAAGSVTSFGSAGNPTVPNQLYTVTYTTPFTYGIAAWPENITNPTASNIYNSTNNRFIENPIVNQTHIWRVTVSYTKSNNIYSQQLDVSLFNPGSGFRVTSVGTIASGRTSGSMTLYLITVADANSIGTGYQLQWSCSDDLTRLTIDNVTRISTYKD